MDARTTYLPLNIFQHLPNLTKLFVFRSLAMMTAMKERHFFLAKELNQIIIVNQNLVELGARVFEGAPNLSSLKLENDKIRNLDEKVFTGLQKLEELFLTSNQIKSLPQKIFLSLESLKRLDLSSNLMMSLPKTLFDHNRFLSVIKFSNNRLIAIGEFHMAQSTLYDFVGNVCVDQVFERTSDVNDFTANNCKLEISFDAIEFVARYRNQREIDAICRDKDMLVTLDAQLKELESEKAEWLSKEDHLESEITKTKIYKNSVC